MTKLNSSGNALAYSTYLGGGTGGFCCRGRGGCQRQRLRDRRHAEQDSDLPHNNRPFQPTCGTDGNCNGGLFDAFVSVINPSGSGFVYSTFLGGESNDEGLGIAVDSAGDAYVTGFTSSTQFPLKSPLQATFGGGILPIGRICNGVEPYRYGVNLFHLSGWERRRLGPGYRS